MPWAKPISLTRRSTSRNPLLRIIFFKSRGSHDQLPSNSRNLLPLFLCPLQRPSATERSLLLASDRYSSLGSRCHFDFDAARRAEYSSLVDDRFDLLADRLERIGRYFD